jgi:hypothetical protein
MTTGRSAHRPHLKKRIIAPVGVMAVTMACLAFALPAQAASGADERGADATPSEWAWDSFTDWSVSDTAPADPDNATGEDNPANLIQVGEGWSDTHDSAYRQKVSDGWKRFTAWQTSDVAPSVEANEEAGHRYERTVGNHDATAGVPAQWWTWSPNQSQGPQDYTPAFPTDPRGTWQGPHTQGGPDGEGTFNVSHGASGNSSWFHREPGTEGTPETTHVEYQWDVYAFHFEYRWSIYERTLTPGVDEKEEAEAPTEPDAPGSGKSERGESDQPAVLGESAMSTGSTGPATQHPVSTASVSTRQHRSGHAVPAVPVSIDAGL